MTGTHGSLILIFSLKTRTDGSLIMNGFLNKNKIETENCIGI
jgi:hypothetical protein